MECDEGGEDGSAKECQGVLVVPGGYPTPMLETARAAHGGVAVPIDFRVRGRPPCEPLALRRAIWSLRSVSV